jgi:hypothetical protein
MKSNHEIRKGLRNNRIRKSKEYLAFVEAL